MLLILTIEIVNFPESYFALHCILITYYLNNHCIPVKNYRNCHLLTMLPITHRKHILIIMNNANCIFVLLKKKLAKIYYN